MRFNLHLQVDKSYSGNLLPFSYQYELSSFLYHTLAKGNELFAEWLHNNGFRFQSGRPFRLFCFSNLLIKEIGINKTENRLAIKSDDATLQIGFLPERSTEEFIKGIFLNREFTLGDKKSKVRFIIRSVELLPAPELKEEITGTTLSPICLATQDDLRRVVYISPDTPQAGGIIIRNLIRKYEAFYGQPYTGNKEFEWEVLSQPKAKLITLKAGKPEEMKVKGFLCDFRLKADRELVRIGYEIGIGEKGSMGMGMIKEILG